MLRAWAFTIVGAFAVVGCEAASAPANGVDPDTGAIVSDFFAAESVPVVPSAAELRPAEQVRAETVLTASLDGVFGTPVEQSGVAVTASNPRRDLPTSYTENGVTIVNAAIDAIKVDLRVENRSNSDLQYMNPGLMCSNSDDAETWILGSTFDPWAVIPSGTFSEGAIHLSQPDLCVAPAFFIFELGELRIAWTLPDDLLR